MDRETITRIFGPAAIEALKRFPLDPETPKLVTLSENVTFKVRDRRDGADYVLRLHRPGYHSREALRSERLWTRALSQAGISVPVGVSAVDGNDYARVAIAALGEEREVGLTHWISGDPLSDVMAATTDVGEIDRYWEQLGALDAALHNQSSLWSPPPDFHRHALDVDGLMGDSPFWGPFWEHPIFTPAERRLVLRARKKIREILIRYGQDGRRFSVIHADMHPNNLLAEGDCLSVIDFDDCGYGWHVYDMAVALYQMQWDERFEALQDAFLRGYQRLRQLDEQDLALLPVFLLVRVLAVIGWLLQRPEIDASERIGTLTARACSQSDALLSSR
jgi:Ser/Thr protein kinase RdoA (MazF antagonist)